MEEGQLFEGPPVDYGKLAGDVAGEIKGRIEDAISKNKSNQAKKRLDKLPQNT